MSQQGPFGTVEVRIPILQRNQSVIDEYGGGDDAKNQFALEMRKMEEEMNKLTGQISEGNKRIASRIVQTTKTTTTRTSSGQNVQDSQPQPQIQQQSFNSINQSSNQSNQFDNQQFIPSQIQGGANVQESRTTTVHKTVSHSNSGQNLLQNQSQNQAPQQIQWQQPGGGAGSNLQESRSVHSTSTHSTTGSNTGQNFQSQPQPQVQWSSPAGGNVQENRTSHSTHSTSHHSNTGHQTVNQNLSQQDTQNNTELQQWLGNLDSPLINNHQEISGQDGKCLRLRFDVSQYKAEEISVKMVDGKLRIHAKHEEKTENRSSYREFNKEFSLPIGTNPEAIKSSLSKDGILTVEAPFPNQLQGYGGNLPITNY